MSDIIMMMVFCTLVILAATCAVGNELNKILQKLIEIWGELKKANIELEALRKKIK